MNSLHHYIALFFLFLMFLGYSQHRTSQRPEKFAIAYELARKGEHSAAKKVLSEMIAVDPKDDNVLLLLAKVNSWTGEYDRARREFNRITSKKRGDREIWIAAIKNELYAGAESTALGLANKALHFLEEDAEVQRLKAISIDRIANKEYPDYTLEVNPNPKKPATANKVVQEPNEIVRERRELPNRLNINNTVTVFDDQNDPIIFSSLSYRYLTPVGSVIPRINYTNRTGRSGVQYDLDFYPRFLKRCYAYINYGYSSSTLYPNHKFGGDIYVNLPKGIELSAGGRYIKTNTQDITAVTNSAGYYTGNYYFSMRSYITPRPNGLTRFSANLLVRKYGKDAENFMGVTVGMGVSPGLRQFIVDNELLAETIFYTESQRMNLTYQFTGKKHNNGCRLSAGVRRQEVAFESGNFFWAFTTGVTYQIKM
ncbi:MAG: YaiO family outer membrane beta-barrel protein [Bacteroidota bacterium]